MEPKTCQVELIWNVSISRGSNFTITHAWVTRSKQEWEVQHNYSHLLAILKLSDSPPYCSNAKYFPVPGLLPSAVVTRTAPTRHFTFHTEVDFLQYCLTPLKNSHSQAEAERLGKWSRGLQHSACRSLCPVARGVAVPLPFSSFALRAKC